MPPKPVPTESSGLDDLERDRPDFKTTLILKKNQRSMEGRQNQVWASGRVAYVSSEHVVVVVVVVESSR